MYNFRAKYQTRLFEYIRRGRNISPVRLQCDVNAYHHEKEKRETNNVVKKFRKSLLSEIKQWDPTTDRNRTLSISSFDNLKDRLNYVDTYQTIGLKIKLQKIIDVFPLFKLPPIIKNKSNVIIIIEKNKAGDFIDERRCRDCFNELHLQEIKKKVSVNFNKAIGSLRTLLLRGIKKAKNTTIVSDQPVGFFTMGGGDIVAPFPDVEAYPIPEYALKKYDLNLKSKYPRSKPPIPRSNSVMKRLNHTRSKSVLSSSKEFFRKIDKKPFSKNNIGNSIRHKNSIATHSVLGKIKKPHSKSNFERKKNHSSQSTSEPQPGETEAAEVAVKSDENAESTSKNEPDPTTEDCKIEVVVRRNETKKKDDHQQSKQRRNFEFQKQNREELRNRPRVTEIPNYSTIDISSSPAVTIIPLDKVPMKGKTRDMFIKLINVPENVDMIKIKSLASQLYPYAQGSDQTSREFIRSQLRIESFKNQAEYEKSFKNKCLLADRFLTCPNKVKLSFEEKSKPLVKQDAVVRNWADMKNDNLRSKKKNDCYYDG